MKYFIFFPFQSPSTIHCGKRSRIFAQCNAFGFCVDIFRRSGGGYASWQRYEALLPSCSSDKQIVHAYGVHFPHNFLIFFGVGRWLYTDSTGVLTGQCYEGDFLFGLPCGFGKEEYTAYAEGRSSSFYEGDFVCLIY